jgi:hypothetical protein
MDPYRQTRTPEAPIPNCNLCTGEWGAANANNGHGPLCADHFRERFPVRRFFKRIYKK